MLSKNVNMKKMKQSLRKTALIGISGWICNVFRKKIVQKTPRYQFIVPNKALKCPKEVMQPDAQLRDS